MEEWSGCLLLEDSRYGGWRSGLKSKQLSQNEGGPGPDWVNTLPTLEKQKSQQMKHSFLFCIYTSLDFYLAVFEHSSVRGPV